MSTIYLIKEKAQGIRPLFMQIFVVTIAFTLMVVASCVIMSRTLNHKLSRNADQTMNDLRSYIAQTSRISEITLNYVADKIEKIYANGEGLDMINAYMTYQSSFESKDRMDFHNSFYSLYGYFDKYDVFIDGGGWVATDDFVPQERPWYEAALRSDGKVETSDVYIDAHSQTAVVAYTRQLFDGEGNRLGVVSIDVPMDYIRQIISDSQITENGYGFVVDQNMQVIIHPNDAIVGETFGESNTDLYQFTEYVAAGVDLSSQRIQSYNGTSSISFGRKLDNGWYLFIMIPEAEYYQDLYQMILYISALGFILACMLSAIIYRIDTAKNKADEANRQKSNFLASMSHEIRTPLNVILGITENSLHSETLPDKYREECEKVYSSGNLLLNIINDILDLSKIEAGKMEIVPVKYDVSSLINDAAHLNMMRFDHKPIEFKLNVDEKLPLQLIGDELRIKQILNNILSNAFNYTHSGEVTLHFEAEYAVEDVTRNDNLIFILRVSDTGIGMSDEQMKNLFGEYTRFNLEANRKTLGTGLGMAITNNLVKAMRGEISVESNLGKGSLFTVRLPQGKNGSEPMGARMAKKLEKLSYTSTHKKKKEKIVREYMPYGKVLIIDDMPTNLDVAVLILKPYGLVIELAQSGYEAIEIIKKGNEYDIIFMDHMMPEMDGIETVKKIRSLGYKHPIVALTANALAGQSDMFLANGFDGFISKPIDRRELNASLNRLIRDKQPPEVLEAAKAAKTSDH